MKNKPSIKTYLLVALSMIALLSSSGSVSAQGVWPLSPQDSLGTGFTYQGRLEDSSGSSITATCDFSFSLWDSLSSTTGQVGADSLVTGVSVVEGYFVAQVNAGDEFYLDAFTGEARWLEVAVKCGSETTYTTLSPRQPLSAAPYALSLRPGAHIEGEDNLVVENTSPGTGGYIGDSAIVGRIWSSDNNSFAVGGFVEASSGVTTAIYGKNESDAGAGVTGYSLAQTGETIGVYGVSASDEGYGVAGSNSNGIAIAAEGSGIIYSTADTVLYISPHEMVLRNSGDLWVPDLPDVILYPMESGGVRAQAASGASFPFTAYLSIPISTYGTLLGSQMYVKSLEICYTSPTSTIDVTAMMKNDGTTTGYSFYLFDDTDYHTTNYDCYTLTATAPYTPIDNSSWVQFNVNYVGSGIPPFYVEIYTVKLTLTEESS